MKKILKKIITLNVSYEFLAGFYFASAFITLATGETQGALTLTAIGWVVSAIAIIEKKDLGVNFNGPVTVNHKKAKEDDEQ